MFKKTAITLCLALLCAGIAFADARFWDISIVKDNVLGDDNRVYFDFLSDGKAVIGYMDEFAGPDQRNAYLSVQGEAEGDWTTQFISAVRANEGLTGLAIGADDSVHLSYIYGASQFMSSQFDAAWNQSTQFQYGFAMDSGFALDNNGAAIFEYSVYLSKYNNDYLRIGAGSNWDYVAGFPGANSFDWENGVFDPQGNMMFSLMEFENGNDFGTAHYFHRTAAGAYSDFAFEGDALDARGLFVDDSPVVAVIEKISETENQIVLYEFADGVWNESAVTDIAEFNPVTMDIALDLDGALSIAFACEDGSIWYTLLDGETGAWSDPGHVYGPMEGVFDAGLINLEMAYDGENQPAIAFYDPSEEAIIYALDPPVGGVVPEPSIVILTGIGLASLAGIIRRKLK